MELVIDRFEGNYAIAIDKDLKNHNIEKELIPDAKENDIISIKVIKQKENNNIDDLLNELFIK